MKLQFTNNNGKMQLRIRRKKIQEKAEGRKTRAKKKDAPDNKMDGYGKIRPSVISDGRRWAAEGELA